MLKTLKTRFNFATNSSSSHSLIHCEGIEGLHDDLDFDDHYGWSDFLLVSLEEKLRYVATQFVERISLEDEALLETLPPPLPNGVDHQSADMFTGMSLQEAILLVSDPRVVIQGGNDNDDSPDYYSPYDYAQENISEEL